MVKPRAEPDAESREGPRPRGQGRRLFRKRLSSSKVRSVVPGSTSPCESGGSRGRMMWRTGEGTHGDGGIGHSGQCETQECRLEMAVKCDGGGIHHQPNPKPDSFIPLRALKVMKNGPQPPILPTRLTITSVRCQGDSK